VLHNQYGPTETHASTSFLLAGDPAEWPELPSVGRPIANATAWILDDHKQLVPIGVPGEIYHGGECLSRGYLGRPDLTAERYEPDAFAPGRRAYRTGDRARYRRDGTIEFLARADHQVKIRGFRVEPAEIEAILSRHRTVRDVAVIAVETDQPGERRLAAYLVCPDGPAADYRTYLSGFLPDYMIPSAFVFLDGLPLTPSGKLDRRALPTPEPGGESAFVEPRTALERVVAAVFGLVLGVEEVGRDDDFFLLGGHSLIATRMMSALRDALDVEIALKTLLGNATVSALAAAVHAGHGDAVEAAAELFLAVVERSATTSGGVR
jgi:acyl carrier protein